MKFARIIATTINVILIAGTMAFLAFVYRAPLERIYSQLLQQYLPCRSPITYSIGTFDKKFGISQNDFLAAIKTAEEIWEKPIGKELFAYVPDGKLKINLIYDDRQAATEKLATLGITVTDDQKSYDVVKAKYTALVAVHTRARQVLDAQIADFKARSDAYTAEVQRSNKRGGASPDTYARLNEERASLEAQLSAISKLQNDYNVEVGDINAFVDVLNRLADTLHIEATRYNTIGAQHSGEFTEGEYTNGPAGTAINVYQFDDKNKLVRVLAHELGHALGLEHVDDQKAIMYRLNNGVNEKLTAADIAALKQLCGIK